MTSKNAIKLFHRFAAKATKRSDIRIYQEFIRILSNLENRELTQAETESIESKLDAMELTGPVKKIVHYRTALRRFERYLLESFSFVTKGYYKKRGIAFGAVLGVVVGTVWLSDFERSIGISLAVSVGTLLGIIVADYLESRAKSSGKLI